MRVAAGGISFQSNFNHQSITSNCGVLTAAQGGIGTVGQSGNNLSGIVFSWFQCCANNNVKLVGITVCHIDLPGHKQIVVAAGFREPGLEGDSHGTINSLPWCELARDPLTDQYILQGVISI